MNSKKHSLLTLLLLLHSSTTLSATTQPPQPPPQPPPFTRIYAFGDSYTDTGNTISAATAPSGYTFVSHFPYGITFFHHPTNRYSDGRLVIDFLSQSLSLPFLPPHRGVPATSPADHGVNFAVAGATAIEHGFFVRNNLSFDVTPESLGTQLEWFERRLDVRGGCSGGGGGGGGGGGCGGAWLDDALFWIGEIGANDYAYASVGAVNQSVVQTLAITRISSFLKEILKKGAKYVIVQGLPPTGCLTMSMVLSPSNDRDQLGCVRSLNKLSSDHNTLLQSHIRTLQKQFPHSLILYADYYSAYTDIMKDLAKYGFNEPFKACCGSGSGPYNYDFFSACGSPSSTACASPNKFINWDGVHLTEAMNKVVSEMFIQGGYCHPPFQYLLSRKKAQG